MSLPKFFRDTTDRNRTSPFAFTGNKFEFRMLGSSNSIACANIMLNSAVAASLEQYADELESEKDFDSAVHSLIKRTIKDHKRIIFNGNGYDDSWIAEATEKRGLLNLRTTPDCMGRLLDKKNVDMLIHQKIYSEAEIESRYEIMLENYCKAVNIEALTMTDMTRKEILPAVEAYTAELASAAGAKKSIDSELSCAYEKRLINKLSMLADRIDSADEILEKKIAEYSTITDITEASCFIRDEILPAMANLRAAADEAETLTAEKYWPFPTYGKLLFGVR